MCIVSQGSQSRFDRLSTLGWFRYRRNSAKISGEWRPLQFTRITGSLRVSDLPQTPCKYWIAEVSAEPCVFPRSVVWIQGGPGGSSIGGALTELGPFRLDSRSLASAKYNATGTPSVIRNPHSFTTFAGLLAVDYANIGYSFCEEARKCEWDDAKAAGSVLGFLKIFLHELFPEFAHREIWVAGESYAGILITAIATATVRDGSIRLGGILHGNGAVGHFCGCHGKGCSNAWPVGFCTGAKRIPGIT